MQFRILGPLEVKHSERVISVDAPKQRALLGLLLLHPNEVVSTERIVDELWGERPPATATRLVQTYVFQLRRALGGGLITTRAPGYVLCIEAEALDAGRFRRLTAEARGLAANGERERAAAVYRQALALWRGPALADVAFESFAHNEVKRLEEEHLDAFTARIDCDLALGRHERLVAELEPLVKQHPLRERFRAQLMLALYRSGRQADALEVFRAGRRTLVEELGLEPSRELQDLEKAILRHDAELDAPGTAEPIVPGDAVIVASGRAFARRWLMRKPVLVVALVLVAVGLGLVFGFGRAQPSSIRLAPNSIGFVDANSGRVIRSYPVGREPSALAVADDAVWVANYAEQTVTRIDRRSGHPDTIVVGGHPTGLVGYHNSIWVWTLEGLLVRVDPRYDNAADRIRLAPTGGTLRSPGRISAGAGYLWITVPDTTVLRVDPAHPQRRRAIVPEWGAGGPIAERNGQAWVAGSSYAGYVFPIQARTGTTGSGIAVGGPVHDLALGDSSLWVLSGGAVREQPYPKLRAVDLHDQLVRTAVAAGSDLVAVAVTAGSVWVATGTDQTISRVDSSHPHVVETIDLGASPTALAADRDGVWVAVA